MIRIFIFVFAAFFHCFLYSKSVESLREIGFKNISVFEIKEVGLPQLKAIIPKLEPKYSSKTYAFMDMSVSISIPMKEIRGNDFRNKIEIILRKSFNNRFDGFLSIDGKHESFYLSCYSGVFFLSTPYGSLRANLYGQNYYINGSVKNDEGRYQYINLTVYKRYFDDYSYEISETGLDLDFSSYSVGGNFNDEMYSKRVVSYIITMVFAFQLENVSL